MIEVRKTAVFAAWLDDLRDVKAQSRIVARIARMESGIPGDVRSVGEGVVEMRIDYGPGYRVYFVRQGALIVILLCGGDKSTQAADIARAKRMAKEL